MSPLSHGPKSILILGSSAVGSLENAYLRAFRAAGVPRVDIFDVDQARLLVAGTGFVPRALNKFLMPLNAKRAYSELLEHLETVGPHYDVVIVFKGLQLSRDLLEACRAQTPGARWANINPDDPLNLSTPGSSSRHIIDCLSLFDLYCIWSRRLVHILADRGCRRVIYLPFGFDAETHVPPAHPVAVERGSITFIGSWDVEREDFLSQLADLDLRIYGNAWQRVRRRSPLRGRIAMKTLYGTELANVVAGSEISLNMLRAQNLGSHNMRTFEVPAMRGLLVTTRSQEQQQFFPEMEGCLMFDGCREFRAQAELVARDAKLALRIRLRGHSLVQKHSYTARAQEFLFRLNEDSSNEALTSRVKGWVPR